MSELVADLVLKRPIFTLTSSIGLDSGEEIYVQEIDCCQINILDND